MNALMNVSVKWNGKKFDNLQINTSEPPLIFKSVLFSLTGVEPARQKILVKGGTLKDDGPWPDVKPNSTLMMMGTPGELPQEPKEKVVFMEDLTHEELAVQLKLPMGLVNLGNTCYLNSVLQCFRGIAQLSKVL
jgi:ubiquitin carboxyl-terminal hydrolase 14